MTKASLTLRIVYAVCLAGATCVHVAMHVQYGMLLGALEGYGYSSATRFFWSSLTLLDPLAALLMFIRPHAGLALAGAIILSDVLHNSWILHHFGGAPDAAYWAQVAFLVFLFVTIRVAWRGSSRCSGFRNEKETA
jgi:hypothetical protein